MRPGAQAGALHGERGERRRGDEPHRDTAGHRGGPKTMPAIQPQHQRVRGVAPAHDVLDVEDLDGQRGGDEQQRADGGDERDPQDPVAPQQPQAVERAPCPAHRAAQAGGGRATRRRHRDRQERRGVDEQRHPRAERRQAGGQQRPGSEAA